MQEFEVTKLPAVFELFNSEAEAVGLFRKVV
jgi:hypothetical protein